MTQTDPGRLDPKGRVMMISGPDKGIGAAIAQRPRRESHDLSLARRPPAGLREPLGEGRMHRPSDAVDPESPHARAGATGARFGRIDGPIDNIPSGAVP